MTDSDEHSSLLSYRFNSDRQKFIVPTPKFNWNRLKLKMCSSMLVNSSSLSGKSREGNTNWSGSTIDLLIKLACFVRKIIYIFSVKMSRSKLVCTRRSIVLSLPFSKGSLVKDFSSGCSYCSYPCNLGRGVTKDQWPMLQTYPDRHDMCL
jgi:hypothetical protein